MSCYRNPQPQVVENYSYLSKGPFNNYVMLIRVKRCVTERSQSNVKKRYEGGRGGQKSSKKVLPGWPRVFESL